MTNYGRDINDQIRDANRMGRDSGREFSGLLFQVARDMGETREDLRGEIDYDKERP